MKTPTPTPYIEGRFQLLVDELCSWLAIPSVSSLPEHSGDVLRGAQWVYDKLASIGFGTVELLTSPHGYPLVYAESCSHREQPTLLIYGHYDVQPVDPIEEWHTPPFSPTITDGNIFCRGASDDKGQIMAVIGALEAWFRTEGKLPINIKVLLEGEEEAGGETIANYVQYNREKLDADCVLICDTHMIGASQPSLITSLRGILYAEFAVSGAATDLHSGTFGGVAPNPIHALCILLSRLKGEDGKINIPELANCQFEPGEDELQFWKNDPLGLCENLKKEMGVTELIGELGFPPLQRLGLRPTLEVHGIRGGFTGDGAKTVIPAKALAKVSMRLPAGLDPAEVFGWLEKAARIHLPAGHRLDIRNLHAGRGVAVSADNPFFNVAMQSLETTYGVRPVTMREGGSIPIAALFDAVLNVPIIFMGFGLPDDNLHAPNEKFSMDQLKKGMITVADFLGRLANM